MLENKKQDVGVTWPLEIKSFSTDSRLLKTKYSFCCIGAKPYVNWLQPEAHEKLRKKSWNLEGEFFWPAVSKHSTDLWMPCLQLLILLLCHQHGKCISRSLLMLYCLFENELGTVDKGQKKPFYLRTDMHARLYLIFSCAIRRWNA